MDFVGPRFIKGYGPVSSLHLIDVVSTRVHIEQFNSKRMDNVIAFLVEYWSNNPIPKYLQVDNGMYFIGDFKNPRGFSRFVRLCLYVGIEVVFIAPSSPWMDGSIENFNNWFGSKFWDKETYRRYGRHTHQISAFCRSAQRSRCMEEEKRKIGTDRAC